MRARLRRALREDDEEFVLARRALLCSVLVIAARCGPRAGVAGVAARLRVLLFT